MQFLSQARQFVRLLRRNGKKIPENSRGVRHGEGVMLRWGAKFAWSRFRRTPNEKSRLIANLDVHREYIRKEEF